MSIIPLRLPVTLALLLTACSGKSDVDTGDSAETGETGDTETGDSDSGDSDSVAASGLALIPAPALVEVATGTFVIDASTDISVTSGGENEATLLAESLRPATGFAIPVTVDGTAAIALQLLPDVGLPAEGYTLDVTPSGVTVTASDTAGLYYGTQTLRQLLPPSVFAAAPVSGVPWTLPCVHIEDAPRFAWRGWMLDVARHFFDVATVEREIDVMALHKLNRLHLHLTDDQGWRIEIRSWPLLTEIGGSTEVGGGPGGWYTQTDYTSLVAYAAHRHVTVVPEIDLPGHANAALASYGDLNPGGVPEDLYTGTSVLSKGLWLDASALPGFLADVWHELAALTPGAWAHIGGDEAVDIDEADYVAFIPEVQQVLSDEGKTLVGWDEIGVVDLDPPFLAQHWYHLDLAVAAADRGAQIVASPAEHTYLDMVYDNDAEYGQVWAGPITIETAYSWNPVADGLAEGDILGVEGALWTEYIDTTDKLEFMVWPRLACHAEVGWSPASGRSWREFSGRMAWHGARLEALGVAYYRSPELDWVTLAETR